MTIRRNAAPSTTAPKLATPLRRSMFDDALYRRVAFALIPCLFVCYVVAMVDRLNVGLVVGAALAAQPLTADSLALLSGG